MGISVTEEIAPNASKEDVEYAEKLSVLYRNPHFLSMALNGLDNSDGMLISIAKLRYRKEPKAHVHYHYTTPCTKSHTIKDPYDDTPLFEEK